MSGVEGDLSLSGGLEGKNEEVSIYTSTQRSNSVLTWIYCREVDRLSAEVNDYEGFLNDLRNASESRASDWIRTLLEKVCSLSVDLSG